MVPTEQLVMIDSFLIDCILSEDYSYESEVTDFPVESGAIITDNVRPKPIVVTLECLVSNTPIGPLSSSRAIRSGTGLFGPIRQAFSTPAQNAFNLLESIYSQREPVPIRTTLKTYRKMAMKTLSIPRASGRGDDLKFTATFQEIQEVTNKRGTRVAVPGAKGSKTDNKPPKNGDIVHRLVDPYDNTWNDPDISGWREGASYNKEKGHWEFFKGRPLHVSNEDWATKPHQTDAEYKANNEAGLLDTNKNGTLKTDKKTNLPTTNGGQQFKILNADEFSVPVTGP